MDSPYTQKVSEIRGGNRLNTGQYEAARKSALEALELAEKTGDGIQKVFSLAYAGRAAMYAGIGDSASELLQKGEVEGKKVGHPFALAVLRVTLAEILLRLGKTEESMEPAEAALRFCQKLDLGQALQWALQINAEILANRVPIDEARIEEMMEQDAALLKRSDSPWDRIGHLMAWARINQKLNRTEAARESLSEARDLYREMCVEDGTEQLRSLEQEMRK